MVYYQGRVKFSDESTGVITVNADGTIEMDNIQVVDKQSTNIMLDLIAGVSSWLGSNGGTEFRVNELGEE